MRTNFYPLFLDVEGRDVLVVGGGGVAARKAEGLLRYGARVTIVAPAIGKKIAALSRGGEVKVALRPYRQNDVKGRTLVFAATDDAAVNAAIVRDCRERKIPVNVVEGEDCDFLVPAVIEQGSIQIAVSTGGNSPALARRVRDLIREAVGSEYSMINEVLGTLRLAAKEALPTDKERKAFFEEILESGVLQSLREGRTADAMAMIDRICCAAGVPFVPDEHLRLPTPI